MFIVFVEKLLFDIHIIKKTYREDIIIYEASDGDIRLNVIADYTPALDILDDYDHQRLTIDPSNTKNNLELLIKMQKKVYLEMKKTIR